MRLLHTKGTHPFQLPLVLAGVVALLLTPAAAAGSDDTGNPPASQRLADADITRAIEAKMIGDASVPFDALDVETRQGIVTLSGEVDDMLARDRALEIAESIKGVRAVVQEITVEPAWRSDADIHGDVEAALLMDPAADSYEIDASVDEGSVTLEGRVDSWQEKQVAADVVSGVRGVREVNNQLAVDFDLNRSDSEIAADVRKRLEWDVRLGDGLIDAEVQDGRVELTGWVGSAAELTLARSSAWVAGTREVDTSGLDVRWWADDGTRSADYSVRTDADIEQAVRDAFLYDPRVLSFEPEVRVENGEVTLSGVVDNAEARRAAEMDARNTVGVWRVRNHIKVRPTETPADADLVQSVRKAIARDPYLERHPITVLAEAGHITLEGRVDYDYEKQRADRVARRMAGVSSVGNELRVDHNWTWRSDFEIRRSIEDELYWSPFVDSDAVSVTVENGVATLQGTVDDWSEAIHAIDNARDGGARRVRSRLEIATIDSLS